MNIGVKMVDAKTTKIQKPVLCRDEQLQTLHKYIGYPWEKFPNALLLVGHTDTGKSLTVDEVIGGFKWKYRIARIDCCSCISAQILLTSILDQIVVHKPGAENGYKPYCRIDNMCTFVNELKKASCNRARKKFRLKKIFIILDHCEKLFALNPNFPKLFLKLQELTELLVTVIMSVNVFPSIKWFDTPPIVINFPQYSKAEMVIILSSERPTKYDDMSAAYESYVKMMVDLMFRDCRQLGVIRSELAVHENAVMTGDLDARLMWGRLHQATAPSLPMPLTVPSLPTCPLPSKMKQTPSKTLSWAAMTHNLDLPYCTKFLLISAMLAAHIPQSEDAKLFVSARPEGSKRRCRKRKIITAPENSSMVLGPRTFAVNRLFAIFYAIFEDPLPMTVQLQSQVSSLVKLELLRDVSVDLLSERKLAFTASADLIIALARTVDFDLEKYISLAM